MALAAKCDEVGEYVRFAVTRESEITERDDMSNGQFFRQLVTGLTAMLARVIVAPSCLVALLSPVWAVVGSIAALPMRALFRAEMCREPLQPAPVAAEPLSRRAGWNAADLAAHLASVRHAMRLAGHGTVAATFALRCFDEVAFAASLASLFNFRRKGFIPAGAGAKHLIGIAATGLHFLAADWACSHIQNYITFTWWRQYAK